MANVTTIDLEIEQKKIDARRLAGDPVPGAILHTPGIRASLDGSGCTLPNCHCSDGYWITVSNGKLIFRVDLTAEEANAIRAGFLDTLE